MQNLDLFQIPIPAFNVKAEESVKTLCGAATSMIILVTLFYYGLVKTIQLIDKSNVQIAKYEQGAESTVAVPFDYKSTNAKLAVSIQGFEDQTYKNDPRYVKWFVRLFGKKDGERVETHIPFHTCTDEDYDSFYPISPSQETSMKNIRADENAKMICIDWNDDSIPFQIYGETSQPNW